MPVPTTFAAPSYSKSAIKGGGAQVLIANAVAASFTAWVDLGMFENPPTLDIKSAGYTEIKANQWAEVLIDMISKGHNVELGLELMGTDIAAITNAFHDITIAGTTVKKAVITHGIGTSLRDQARPLMIRRLSDPASPINSPAAYPATTTADDMYVFPYAAIKGDITETFDGNSKNSVWKITVVIFADIATPANGFGYRGAGTSS